MDCLAEIGRNGPWHPCQNKDNTHTQRRASEASGESNIHQNRQTPHHTAVSIHFHFQSVQAVYLGVCFGVFNLFPHTKLIKAGRGPQRSCRFARREIALLSKDSA